MSTFYVSGKAGRHEGLVRMISRTLEQLGYKNSCDWPKLNIKKPFERNFEETRTHAETMTKAVDECDIFILISDDGLVGAYIELGFAIASARKNPKKKVIVFEFGEIRSAFYTLPQVQIIRDIGDIKKVLGH